MRLLLDECSCPSVNIPHNNVLLILSIYFSNDGIIFQISIHRRRRYYAAVVPPDGILQVVILFFSPLSRRSSSRSIPFVGCPGGGHHHHAVGREATKTASIT